MSVAKESNYQQKRNKSQAEKTEENNKEREKQQAEEFLKTIRSDVNKRMEAAAGVIKKVSNKLAKNPAYTTFLEFRMNDLVVNCCSNDVNKNLLMSFENSKNGSGQANSFNIRIAYSPQLGEGFNISKIDNALTKGTRDGYTMSSRYCTLTYGYGDSVNLRTITYTGMVIDYTCDIQDSMLVYDISGYSGITMWTESKTALSVNGASTSSKIKPTAAVKYLVNQYLGEKSSISTKPYQIIFDDNVEDSDVEVELPASLDKNIGKAITDILNKAVAKVDKDKMDKGEEVSAADKHIYYWYISDQVSDDKYAGTIFVTCYSATELKEQKASASAVFNWMSPGADGEVNHIVQSFRPEFKGSVLLSLAAQQLNNAYRFDNNAELFNKLTQLPEGATVGNVISKEKATEYLTKQSKLMTDESLFTGSFFMDNTGLLQMCQSSLAPVVGGDKETVNMNIEATKSTWAKELQYPYNASMVTAGIPCEIPITGVIRIVPMIYGQPHFSAGNYLVKSTRDIINTNGWFTTEWDLQKIDMIVPMPTDEKPTGDKPKSDGGGNED